MDRAREDDLATIGANVNMLGQPSYGVSQRPVISVVIMSPATTCFHGHSWWKIEIADIGIRLRIDYDEAAYAAGTKSHISLLRPCCCLSEGLPATIGPADQTRLSCQLRE